ncbi:OmpA family protein [candidate division WOR-3 bacterium]|nr:OmpA family protein [candidate division WOR-3 bacterium]
MDGYKISSIITITVKQDQKQIVDFKVVQEKKPLSILAGTIKEKDTGRPCIAVISFPETDLPETHSDETGAYKVELVSGTYIVKIEKTDYVIVSEVVVCEPGETSILDIELIRRSQTAILVGKVVDASTNYGLLAEISFPGIEQDVVQTDAETGTYRIELPPGTYTVKIKSEGYVAEGAVVTLSAKQTVEREFKLFKKGERIILHGIKFATNSAEVKPVSYPILDESVALLKEHSTIKVEVAGHTDAVGSDVYNLNLSNRRAESVRDYLILHGIEAERLIARGYGENQPIASNDTEEGRAQNRRIEFRILE